MLLQGPRLQPAEMLLAYRAQKCRQSHLSYPRSPSPRSTPCPRKSWPSASFPWLLPLNTISPRCGLSLTVHQALPWHSFEMRTGYFPFIHQKAPFLLRRPQTFSGGVCRTPSISPLQRWGREIHSQSYRPAVPQTERQVTGSQVTPTLQQQELQTA